MEAGWYFESIFWLRHRMPWKTQKSATEPAFLPQEIVSLT